MRFPLLRGVAVAVAVAVAFLVSATVSQAAVIGFGLDIDGSATRGRGSADMPRFTLTNDGTAALVGFRLTIGDDAFNFDGITGITRPDGGRAIIVEGDRQFAGASPRSDAVAFAFTGFDAGESASFYLDIDPDTGNSPRNDFSTVLFGNGAAPNAVATASFRDSDGAILSLALTLGDVDAAGGRAAFRASAPLGTEASPSAVPLPAALPFTVLSMIGLAAVARRRPHLRG